MVNYSIVLLKRTGLMWMISMFLSGCATQDIQHKASSGPSNELSSLSSTNQINDLLIVDCAVPIADSNDFYPTRSTAKNCRKQDGKFTLHGSRDDHIKIWEKKAKQGDPIAQNYIGEIYEKGIDQAPDYSHAKKWYEMAAIQGLSRAQNNLAVLHQNGLGVKEDPLTALYWYKRAANFDEIEDPAEKSYSELSRLRQTINHKSEQLRRMRHELKDTLKKLNSAMQALKQSQVAAPV